MTYSHTCQNPECSVTFTCHYKNQLYCSTSCSNKCRVRVVRDLPRCRYTTCVNLVSRRTKHFCDDCVKSGRHRMKNWDGRLLSELTVGEYCKRGGANRYDNIRQRARAAIIAEQIPLVCADCSWDKHVEVCHIQSISSFPKTSLVSEVNAVSNLKLLCPNCHWLFDNSLTR